MKRRPFISVIVVGAGAGKRFDHKLPKQFANLAGRPVIVHSLQKFDRIKSVSEIVVVLPKRFLNYFQTEICTKYQLKKVSRIIEGGSTRQESVYRGLAAVDKQTNLVLVHDAVRPLVTEDEILRLIKVALKTKAAILAKPLRDTVKQVQQSKVVKTHPREEFWLAQTPQAFEIQLLKKAYRKAMVEGFEGTDCSSLVERLGVSVKVVEGRSTNLKITQREDLILAEGMLKCSR